MIRQALVVISLALLAGCAGTQKYDEPSEGPRARVRFASTANYWAILYSYGDKTCKTDEREWMRLYGSYLFGDETNPSLGMPLPLPLHTFPTGTVKEVYVSADPHYLMFQSARQGIGPERITETFVSTTKTSLLSSAFFCGTPFSMEFEKGKDYEIVFHFQGSSCSVDIFDIAKDEGGEYYRKEIMLAPTDIGPCKKTLKKRLH